MSGEEPSSLPKAFLRPAVLILLTEQPSHGYEMLDQLRQMGLTGLDTGGLYRSLRSMEEDGLVCSQWETSPSGPPRRSYELTVEGEAALVAAIGDLVEARDRLGWLVARYHEQHRAGGRRR